MSDILLLAMIQGTEWCEERERERERGRDRERGREGERGREIQRKGRDVLQAWWLQVQ